MTLTPKRVSAARVLALIADLIEIALLPLFVQGALSPVNNILDVVVALVMISLLGWHWALLPAFVAELVPFWSITPTWTAAVLIATRSVPMVPTDLRPETPAGTDPNQEPRS